MKTPDGATDISVGCKALDETKHWLEYCHSAKACADCSYDKRDFPHCVRRLLGDAINGYQQLESRLAQVERERDAAVADIEKYKGCGTCKFQDVQAECDEYQNCCECDNTDCPCYGASVEDCWQWRGVCEENTKEKEK